MIQISAIILTKNEEENIVDCIESLKFCDEILVIDDHSQDRTVEIVKHLGVAVYPYSDFYQNFSRMRNFGLEKAKGDWVLFVDADERVPIALQKEIQTQIANPEIDGYFLKRRDVIWNKELLHGECGNISFLRVGRKNKGIWKGKVHEIWRIKGKTEVLTNCLLHYPHKSINAFLQDINFYTDLRAQELYEEDEKVTWVDIVMYPLGKFFLNYVIKLGFKDGAEGLLHAVLMSFHSFLVRGKLYLLIEKRQASSALKHSVYSE